MNLRSSQFFSIFLAFCSGLLVSNGMWNPQSSSLFGGLMAAGLLALFLSIAVAAFSE